MQRTSTTLFAELLESSLSFHEQNSSTGRDGLVLNDIQPKIDFFLMLHKLGFRSSSF
jgi:hypothetical protein